MIVTKTSHFFQLHENAAPALVPDLPAFKIRQTFSKAAIVTVIPLLLLSSAPVHPAERDIQRTTVFKRTPQVSEQQATAYLEYVDELLLEGKQQQALAVVKLLTYADGVSEPNRLRAEQLLDDLTNAGLVDDEQDDTVFPTIGWYGNLSLYASATDDDDLVGYNNGRLDAFDADASLSVEYTHNQTLSALVEVGVASDSYLDDYNDLIDDPSVYRGETWINIDLSTPSTSNNLTIGSQSVYDNRGWWWDDTLDLINLTVEKDSFALKTGIGKDASHHLFGERYDDNDSIIRGLGELSYAWRENHTLSALIFAESDQSSTVQPGMYADSSALDDSGRDLQWLGIRAQGFFNRDSESDVEYWANLAHVGGKEISYELESSDSEDQSSELVTAFSETRLNGWGLDMGLSMETSLPANPTLTFGFATTTTDSNPGNAKDLSFRQTGLQSNQADLDPFYDVSYYGLVLNPELSNLQVLTFGIGFNVLTNSYISVMAHDYQLLTATDYLRSADLDLTFDGIGKHVGQEIDFILSVDEWYTWDFTVLFGMFQAGKAVLDGEDDTAYHGSIELSVDF